MKKNRLFIILSLIALSTNLFAEIGIEEPNEHMESPYLFDDNTTKESMGSVTMGNTDQQMEDLVGEDNLVDENITKGTYSPVRLGEYRWHKMYDESGNLYMVDDNGTIYDPELDTLNEDQEEELLSLEEEYQVLRQQRFLEDQNLSHDEKTRQLIISDQKTYQIKKKQLGLVNRSGETVRERVSKYAGAGTSKGGQTPLAIFTNDQKGLEYKKENGEELTLQESQELNATIFYREHLTHSPAFNRNEIVKSENSVAFAAAFQDITVLKEELLSRLKGGIIKCQLSRNLVPSYMCPLIGKTALRFPTTAGNTRKVDLQEALDECNDFCISEPGFFPTVKVNVLADKTFTIANDNFEVFPNFDTQNRVVELDNDDRMPLDFIEFTFELPNPEDSNLTEEEWEDELRNEYKPQIKFTLYSFTLYQDKKGVEHESVNRVYDNYLIYLNRPLFKFKLPITDPAVRYQLVIKKPFFGKNTALNKFKRLGGTIKLSKIHSEYTSTDYHYCVVKQFVPFPSYCFGGPSSVEYMNVNGQDMFLCRDREHKIGPELTTGAFYKESKAKDACRVREKCKPTYTHYNPSTTESDLIFEAKIGCVDSPDNVACSDQLCEELFMDSDRNVLNEAILGLGDKSINWQYTIQNSARTKVHRPKINFSEISTTTSTAGTVNYEDIFRNEEKDSAYLYMVDNQSYNRIWYRIGTESPARTAYTLFGGSLSAKGLKGVIKPASFDYVSTDKHYVYAIKATDHIFYPAAGTWIINGNQIVVTEIQAENERINNENAKGGEQKSEIDPPLLMDRSYSIKTGPNIEDWEVFRRIKNHRYYMVTEEDKIIEDPDTGLPKPVTVVKKEWIEIPAYKSDSFEKYNDSLGSFQAFAKSQEAPYFEEVIFNPAKTYYNFVITENIDMTRINTKGLLIHDQAKINHNTSYQRLYNVNYKGGFDSNVLTENFWLVYSDHKLSYHEIQVEIEGSAYLTSPIGPQMSKWSLYDMINKKQYNREVVPHDGEINNHIIVFKKGTPEDMTFSVKWTPTPKEKGTKVFKFAFLFSDIEINNFDFQ